MYLKEINHFMILYSMHIPMQLLIYFKQWLTIKAEILKATNVNMSIYQHYLYIKFRDIFQMQLSCSSTLSLLFKWSTFTF